jgi:hypothetical protein
MRNLQLTDEESQVLNDYLDGKLAQLDREIMRTDHLEFRNLLKHRRAVLSDVHDRLGAESPRPAAV